MRLVRPAAVLVAAGLLVLGCGDGTGEPSGTTTGPVPTTSPPASGPGGPDTPTSGPGGLPDVPTAPERVEPDPSAVDARPVPIESWATEDAGRTLLVRFWSGVAPCYVPAGVDVVETPEQVTVTVLVGRDPSAGPDVVCIELAKLYEVAVTLEEPLGDRAVVDGAGR
ncbi:MAG: hypothetical protein M5U14_16340 [Acidimicrobiia bacterium]|nr:hypothetical protein [Acidimicrobiia bacterium]